MSNTQNETFKNRFSGREKGLVAVCIIAIIAAIVGFTLFAVSQPPASAAAKVNDTYIQENDVANLINQYRTANDLTDDNTFASTLYTQGTSVAEFRQSFIDQLITQKVVDDRAQELGVVPSDEEINEQVQTLKSSYSFGSDDIWQSTLDSYGMTEDDVRRNCKTSLEEQAIFEKDVIKQTATDSQILAYIQTYLPEASCKHFYRIEFADAANSEEYKSCLSELETLKENNNLDATTFVELVKKYSSEADCATTNGELGWDTDITDEDISDVTDYIEEGEYSDLTYISADGTYEIFFCDQTYTFPSSTDITNLQKSDVPSALWNSLGTYTSNALWSTNCSTYLEYLVAKTQVTYYPVPTNAAYNVDFSTITAS